MIKNGHKLLHAVTLNNVKTGPYRARNQVGAKKIPPPLKIPELEP